MGCPSYVKIGDNLVFSVTTHDPDTGVLTDADAVPPYRVYEDETGAAILNDNMAKLDDANTTGFYSESLACTVGNGFESGKSYTVYIVATVDGDAGGISFGFKAQTGDVDAVAVASIANNALTAAAINADAITAAKIADDALSAEHFNTDSISADALKADASDQIRDALIDDATKFSGADLAELAAANLPADIDAIKAKTDLIGTSVAPDQYRLYANVAYDDTGDNLLILSHLEKNGELQTGVTSGTIKIRNAAGTQQGATLTDAGPDARGICSFTQAVTPIAHDEVYYMEVAILSGGTTYTGGCYFNTAD